MQPNELESLTSDRSSWRTLFKKQVSIFEDNHVQSLQDKRAQRKTGHQPPPDRGFTCDICSHVCVSRIGLFLTSTYSHHFVIRRSVVSTAQSIITVASWSPLHFNPGHQRTVRTAVNGCSALQWLHSWHHCLALARLLTRVRHCPGILYGLGCASARTCIACLASNAWCRSSALVAIVTISRYRRGLCHDIMINKKSTIWALMYSYFTVSCTLVLCRNFSNQYEIKEMLGFWLQLVRSISFIVCAQISRNRYINNVAVTIHNIVVLSLVFTVFSWIP